MKHSQLYGKTARRGAGILALFLLLLPVLVLADPDEWISRAESLYARGDYKGALEYFQRASWERPQDPVLHYNMGVLAETLGRMESAVDYYLAYLRWDLHSVDRDAVKRRVFQLCGKLGSTAYRKQEYKNAAHWYKKAGKLFPKARAVYYNLGKVYEAMGDVQRASLYVDEYRRLSSPQDRQAAGRWLAALRFRQAEAAFLGGEYEVALAGFQEARKWDKNNPGVLLGTARCEERLGLLEKAQKHYIQFLKQAPDDESAPEVLATLGRICRNQAEKCLRENDPKKAEAILLKGLKRNPEDRNLHYLLAKTYLETDRQVLALKHLEDVCRLTPVEQADPVIQDLVGLSLILADNAYRQKDYPNTILFLSTAQFWDPDNPVLAYNLAETYDRQQEYDKSVRSYRKYLSLMPDAPEREEIRARMAYLYFVSGSELYRKGIYLEAQDAFEQALLLRPYDPALLYNLALVLLKRGDNNAAIHFFERYMQYENNPGEIQRVRNQVASLRLLSGESTPADEPPPPPPETARAAPPRQDDAWLSGLGPRQNAYHLLKNGRWNDAISLYEQHLRQFPSDRDEKGLQEEMALVYREQGRHSLLDGRTAQALASLKKARQWAPSESSSYLWEGDLHENLKNTKQALQVYRESLRVVTDPAIRKTIYAKITGILTRELQMALRNQDYELALSTLTQMEPYLTEERKRDVQFQIAHLKVALGRPAEALVHYGLHLQQAPGALENPRLTDEIIRQMGPDWELQSLFEDPSRARTLGLAAAERGDHSKALFFLLTARGQSPDQQGIDRNIIDSMNAIPLDLDPLELLSLGPSPFPASLSDAEKKRWLQKGGDRLQDLYFKGLYEEGLRTIAKLEAAGSPEDYALLKAVFQEKLGQEEEAIGQYKLALQSGDTGSASWISPARNHLCDLMVRNAIRAYDLGQFGRALSLLQEAERLSPQRKDVAFNLGCIYFQEKDPHKALDAFSRYIELTPEESPRKILTQRAMNTLRKQIASAPSVRYDKKGVAVDLVFEQALTLGDLLTSESGEMSGKPEARLLMDDVLLAPYMEKSLERDGGEPTPFPTTRKQ